uniref:RRM domain-containing protein n=1 Tax=Parascaris equorum TaxID=6256 RepID=A0A914R6V5_PAREQ
MKNLTSGECKAARELWSEVKHLRLSLKQLSCPGLSLPYNVQSGRVHDIFALAGKVTWVDLQLDKEGRSKGMAVVQFSHPIEAVQAISMLNNQRVFDRLINVKMDRFDPIDERREGELPIGLRGIGMGLGANGAPLSDVSSIISSLNSPAAKAQTAFFKNSYGYDVLLFGVKNVRNAAVRTIHCDQMRMLLTSLSVNSHLRCSHQQLVLQSCSIYRLLI